jgi:hypothetical protein
LEFEFDFEFEFVSPIHERDSELFEFAIREHALFELE